MRFDFTRKEADELLTAALYHETALEDRALDGETVGRRMAALQRAMRKLAVALREEEPTP